MADHLPRQLAAEFAALWDADREAPDVWAFLEDRPSATPADVLEVLLADQRARFRAGCPLLAEEYLARLPELATDREWKLDLVYGEYRAACQFSKPPSPESLFSRFPDLAEPLALHLQVESLLDQTEDRTGSMETNASSPTPIINEPRADEHAMAPPGFEFLEVVGRGGMGIVYRARDLALNRDVAVKLLQDRYHTDSPAAKRFVEEAQITGQLQHPGVPAVHQVGILADGRPFLAMKLIEGHTLAEILADKSIASGRLWTAFEHLCQTVGYAHAHGVIHRDLKPANVMVGAFGEIQVMDWGLAKILGKANANDRSKSDATGTNSFQIRTPNHAEASDRSTTQAGSILGTPAYMAPEQARGEVDQVDERADVFGLGAILSVMLTKQPPFVSSEGRSSLERAAAGDLDDAFARLGACEGDPELIALCKRCLAADPSSRPRNGGEVATAVARLREAADERAKQAELDRARSEAAAAEQRKRQRIKLALTCAIGLMLAGAIGFAWLYDRQETKQRAEREAVVIGHIDRCEDYLGQGDAPAAAAALQEAEERVAAGGAGNPADRLARCHEDLAILRELDRIDDLRWAVNTGKAQGPQKAAAELPAVFSRYGLIPGTTPPDEAARRVNNSFVRTRLLTGLDRWLCDSRSADIQAILRAADPDRFRDHARAVRVRVPLGSLRSDDDMSVRAVVGTFSAEEQPPWFAVVLGEWQDIQVPRRRQILQAVARQWPRDFGVLMSLGELYKVNQGEDRRESFYRAAIAVRPRSVSAWNNLGITLLDRNVLAEAIAAFHEAIRADETWATPHFNLGKALSINRDPNGSIAAYRNAIVCDPSFADAHTRLGIELFRKRDADGAARECREAIRLDPMNGNAHFQLGTIIHGRGDLDAAIEHYRKAKVVQSGDSEPVDESKLSDALGRALLGKKDLHGATREFQNAVLRDPTNLEARLNLALALQLDGQDYSHRDGSIPSGRSGRYGALDDAITHMKELARLKPTNPIYIGELRKMERWRELRLRLPELIAGKQRPKSSAEACEFAQVCKQPFEKRYVLATRLYAEALAADSSLAPRHRFDAACAAVMAAAGRDGDFLDALDVARSGALVELPDGRIVPFPSPTIDVAEWGYFTHRAHTWLRAELYARERQAKDPIQSKSVIETLTSWKRNPELSTVREPVWLAAMSEVDRTKWTSLWTDVDELLGTLEFRLTAETK